MPGPFGSWAYGVRFAAHLPQRPLGTVTTNVPGPRQPLYALGRRAVEIVPYVQAAEHAAEDEKTEVSAP